MTFSFKSFQDCCLTVTKGPSDRCLLFPLIDVVRHCSSKPVLSHPGQEKVFLEQIKLCFLLHPYPLPLFFPLMVMCVRQGFSQF